MANKQLLSGKVFLNYNEIIELYPELKDKLNKDDYYIYSNNNLFIIDKNRSVELLKSSRDMLLYGSANIPVNPKPISLSEIEND